MKEIVLKKLVSLNSIEFLEVYDDGFPAAIAFNAIDLKTGIVKYIVVDL
jgi:hypothetical protein